MYQIIKHLIINDIYFFSKFGLYEGVTTGCTVMIQFDFDFGFSNADCRFRNLKSQNVFSG
jgi:hypothetical protein